MADTLSLDMEQMINDLQSLADILLYSKCENNKLLERQLNAMEYLPVIIDRSLQCGNVKRACIYYLLFLKIRRNAGLLHEKAMEKISERIFIQ